MINYATGLLSKNNWVVEQGNIDEALKEFKKAKPNIFDNKKGLYGVMPMGDLIKIIRGPFSMIIPEAWLVRLTMEFLTMNSFLSLLEEIYNIAAVSQKGIMNFFSFKNEGELWD